MSHLARLPQRRAMRLHRYDYSQAGAYFITICVQRRECLLGEIRDEIFDPGDYGAIATAFWDELPRHFPSVELDHWVVMPNHVHGIIVLTDEAGVRSPRPSEADTAAEATDGETPPLQRPLAGQASPVTDGEAPTQRPFVGQVVAYYKYQTTKQINLLQGTPGVKFWQRGYYDHIIRHDNALERIREYILTNPQRWVEDQLHPNNPSKW